MKGWLIAFIVGIMLFLTACTPTVCTGDAIFSLNRNISHYQLGRYIEGNFSSIAMQSRDANGSIVVHFNADGPITAIRIEASEKQGNATATSTFYMNNTIVKTEPLCFDANCTKILMLNPQVGIKCQTNITG